jgi:hypothetical protein
VNITAGCRVGFTSHVLNGPNTTVLVPFAYSIRPGALNLLTAICPRELSITLATWGRRFPELVVLLENVGSQLRDGLVTVRVTGRTTRSLSSRNLLVFRVDQYKYSTVPPSSPIPCTTTHPSRRTDSHSNRLGSLIVSVVLRRLGTCNGR